MTDALEVSEAVSAELRRMSEVLLDQRDALSPGAYRRSGLEEAARVLRGRAAELDPSRGR